MPQLIKLYCDMPSGSGLCQSIEYFSCEKAPYPIVIFFLRQPCIPRFFAGKCRINEGKTADSAQIHEQDQHHLRWNAQLRCNTKCQSHSPDRRCRFIQAGRQRKILICADKDRTAKEQHQIHRQNGRGGLDGAAIDSASEKLGTIALAEGRSGIGNQDRQRRCFHAACCRTRRTADEHQKDHHALRRTGHCG